MSLNATTDPRATRSDPPGSHGKVDRISGPVIEVNGLTSARLFDVVRVGNDQLLGEVIRLGRRATVQVFEDTTGVAIGEPVVATGAPLTLELGPGLLGSVFDGTQRPLVALRDAAGLYLPRGLNPPALDREREWTFSPTAEIGRVVTGGDVLGTVPETSTFTHQILVPPDVSGALDWVATPGRYRVEETVARVGDVELALLQRWPIRTPRPVSARLPLTTPLLTGQRVLDALFPVARGGAAVIPGGFGTGKTVLEQAVAKHSQADVVVYIGCGERGNELTEVLQEFPTLVDPRSGAPLMERTVLIANTSNMPVAAREASIYAGVTIAEYFRDQGLDVALLADSTSRWGEALREVSSRLEEIPAEDGYPAYLATRLAGFYERSGSADCLGSDHRRGSVTIVGAVSPAGGDFSEPVTQNSLRMAGCFWALDTSLARQRHYPAVNWTTSYATYSLDDWYDSTVAADWSRLRRWALAVLQEEGELREIVALLGVDAIAPAQRVTLRAGQLLREDFLQQSSYDDVDASCSTAKQYAMLATAHQAAQAMAAAVQRGVDAAAVVDAPVLAELGRMRRWPEGEATTQSAQLQDRVRAALTTGPDPTTPSEGAS